MHIVAQTPVDAVTTAVWSQLSDLATHAEWMHEAQSVHFLSGQRTGVGTVMEVPTRIGPLVTLDLMVVTGWHEGQSIEVLHIGAVSGSGVLSCVRQGRGTLVSWDERIDLPWWLGGRLGEIIARPIVSAIWRRNLALLSKRIESTRP